MKIALAADHRGFKLKNLLIKFLEAKGYSTVDLGTHRDEPCDYPDYIYPAAKAVKTGQVQRAILICYTGNGTVIAANKVRGVRAALAYSFKIAVLSRQHNDANALVLPSYFLKVDAIKRIVLAWLKTDFEGGRHLPRVEKIKKIEEKEND
jgi:ribose 5-phosphate isomerase B